jgi:hypothetical protein
MRRVLGWMVIILLMPVSFEPLTALLAGVV